MRAARAAGMGALGVTRGAFDAATLMDAGAHTAVPSLTSALIYLGYAPERGTEAGARGCEGPETRSFL